MAEDVKRSVGMIAKEIPGIARSGEERALQDISRECDLLAVGILAQIEKLHIDGEGLTRKMRALRASARFWFKKKEIDEMLERLIALEARNRPIHTSRSGGQAGSGHNNDRVPKGRL